MANGAAHDAVSDTDLLARHVEGDPNAFGELVRRHRDRLWAVALRTLGDREEAADAVQDALVSAYRAAHTFRGQSAVTTWLHRITVNACLDRARKAASRKTSPVDDAERLQDYIDELRRLGLEPKGAIEGLVDFPSIIDGKLVYLCWKLGEPEVTHWHELDAGFAGRQSLVAGVSAGDDHFDSRLTAEDDH